MQFIVHTHTHFPTRETDCSLCSLLDVFCGHPTHMPHQLDRVNSSYSTASFPPHVQVRREQYRRRSRALHLSAALGVDYGTFGRAPKREASANLALHPPDLTQTSPKVPWHDRRQTTAQGWPLEGNANHSHSEHLDGGSSLQRTPCTTQGLSIVTPLLVGIQTFTHAALAVDPLLLQGPWRP